ncbi:transcription factor HIVEP3 isoform X2 [Erpetoichthys calabaricus]|uniref:transcription factor HIVEP3 isoform X2 n=1 Tax=Erpetoichthys calabaricus TaxID=27687 RepID=UPI002234D480|nr:transcription factor HIVEP3 isoform X2 [Erpetoichthys calabaricus]
MEAEHSQPTGGEQSSGSYQSHSEHSLQETARQSSPAQQLHLLASHLPQTTVTQHSHQRQCRRDEPEGHVQLHSQHPSTFLVSGKTKKDRPILDIAWQFSDSPGPSGAVFSSTSSSTSSVSHPQFIPPHSGKEVQEGSSRKERKPQKPGKYVCQYCGRPCAKPSVLQKHIRSHTGERPYPCIPCGFSFKTKSNLYKHRKSHAHRIKAGLASSREGYAHGGTDCGQPGEEQEEPTEGESTDSEDETGQHTPSFSHEPFGGLETLKAGSSELSAKEESHRLDDSHAIKQRLALRLSERKRVPAAQPDDLPSFLSPGSKGSTESGYFSRSESAEQPVSPPNANAKTYAEIILGKYGRMGQQQRNIPSEQVPPPTSSSAQEDKGAPFTVPKTQVIEHITKLITINEAVVDTSEIDSVKPRRTSLSRRGSLESPKAMGHKEAFIFDTKAEFPSSSTTSGGIGGNIAVDPIYSQITDPAFLTGPPPTVPLLRSHSMPSSADPSAAPSSSHSFRLSHSFDERHGTTSKTRAGALVPPHHRMLKRQPAIEMPLGTELIPESTPSSSTVTLSCTDPGRKRRGPRLFECEACGARYKKRDNFETHRRYYCPIRPPPESESGTPSSVGRENRPQIMHHRLEATAAAAAMRKRRKEKSLGDEEETAAFIPRPGTVEDSSIPSASFPSMTLTSPIPCSSLEEGSSIPSILTRKSAIGSPLKKDPDVRKTGKEISVIQHTSSFEKQESITMSQECEERTRESSPPRQEQAQHQLPKPPTFSRLVRQHNIQVPEILVTEESDAEVVVVTPTTAPPKEPEKPEEFQWPQRSQSLAQLPAEKLPPKKKRLRLAEAAQSSGESSFESVSLPRSPSQESSLSHTSSRSASFEEASKPDPDSQQSTSRASQGTHMLTVPSGPYQHHHPHREMRRSASEQAPTSAPHPAQIVETRSKSFDFGCLSPQPSSAAWRERRKCLLVRQATLGESEPEDRSVKLMPPVCLPYRGPTPALTEEGSVLTSSVINPDPLGKSLHLLQPPPIPILHDVPPAVPHMSRLPPPVQGQAVQLFPVPGVSDMLSTQMVPHSFLQASQQIYPAQVHLTEHLRLTVPQYPPHLPLQYPSDATPALFLPMTSRMALQMPADSSRESKTLAPPSAPCHSLQYPRPVIAPSSEPLRPVVSLVVPVRIQTHLPTYGSAMYTTVSQVVVSPESPRSAVVVSKMEDDRPRTPFLKIPTIEYKAYLPMTLPVVSAVAGGSEEGYGPSTAGGNKRMLSPAGSLELSAEAQRQQKRVKEEEQEEEDEDGKSSLKIALLKEGKKKFEDERGEGEKFKACEQIPVRKSESIKEEEESADFVKVRGTGLKKGSSSYPSLHTTTTVSWCYLNYIKPNPTTQSDSHTSVYSSWCISMHNPNLPGLSTRVSLSLLHSKQKSSPEIYTMATAPRPTVGKLVPANSRKPRMSEVPLPSSSTPESKKETIKSEKEEEKKGKREEEPSTSKRSEPSRIRIFEGGYKSNEEYVYVRGRGRGKYVCEECGIRCKKPSMLKKHIRTHTDVRPYVCKYCNFAFKTKGNLTKHMKSKAHGKKCQEMGVSCSSVDELEAEEGGTTGERTGGSEEQEEHQFSDVEESEEEEDNEEDEDDEEEESQEDPLSSCSPDTRHSSQSTGGRSDCGQSSQPETPESHSSHPLDREPASRTQDYPSPRRHWPVGREASPASKRSLFSRRHWETSPRQGSPLRCLSPGQGLSPVRALSPGREASPLRCVSPRPELSSPSRHLSPHQDVSPGTYISPERGQSPIRQPSPSRDVPGIRYLSPQRLASPGSAEVAQSHTFSLPPATMLSAEPESSGEISMRISGPGDLPISAERTSLSPTLRFSHMPFPSHTLARTEDYIFSHLPLHSQHSSRAPYVMIPIGGIQMVQSRPLSHGSLTAATSMSLNLESPSACTGSVTHRQLPGKRRKESMAGLLTSGAMEAKQGPSGLSSISAREERTQEHKALVSEDYRVQHGDSGTSLSRQCTGRLDIASASQALQTGGKEVQEETGIKQYGSSCTYSQTSTLAAEFPTHSLDRSASAGNLLESSLSHPPGSGHRRRNLSGEPMLLLGCPRRRTPEAGSSVGHGKDNEAGSTYQPPPLT